MAEGEKLTRYLDEHKGRALSELETLLRIPGISSSPANTQDVARCATMLAEYVRAAGLEHVAVMATRGHPVVYGDWLHRRRDRRSWSTGITMSSPSIRSMSGRPHRSSRWSATAPSTPGGRPTTRGSSSPM